MSCSQFKQQRLPAWQPLLSPGYVAALMILVAVIFLPIGLGITMLNSGAADVTVRYDHLNTCASSPDRKAFTYLGNDGVPYRTGCVYRVSFDLVKPLKAPVYMYYGLSKFYQNHRRYSNSKNDAQLAGGAVAQSRVHDLAPAAVPGDLRGASDTPIRVNNEVDLLYSDFVYAPAGLIAWSMFNDSFTLYRVNEDADDESSLSLICNGSAFSRATNDPIDSEGKVLRNSQGSESSRRGCHKKGIAWETDVSHKYKPLYFPANEVGDRHVIWSARRDHYPDAPRVESNDTYFNEGWYAGEPGHAIPVTTDEDLMVWSRVASMPTFRKLYRVIDEDLPAGSYVVEVSDHYDVSTFGGEKRFVLATLSWIGGKNTFLASLYLVVGVVAGVAALLLIGLHKKYGTRAERSMAMLVAE